MSNICAGNLAGGVNADCTKALSSVKNIAILDKDVSFSSMSDVLNLATWQALFNSSLTAWIPAALDSYERTTDDPTINTTTFGKKKFVREAVPSMVAYVDANLCDYNEMRHNYKGGTYSVALILEDDSIMLSKGPLDTYVGFTANITAAGSDIPLQDAVENSFPVYINFDNNHEFHRSRLFSVEGWSPLYEFPAAMPNGLTMWASSVYDTASNGDVTVEIYERCGDPMLLLVTADFEVLSSNGLTSVAITAVETGLGVYVLTIQKDVSPANLDSGDWVIFRVKNGSDPYTDLSGRVNVIAP
jgi:hypothetical protein